MRRAYVYTLSLINIFVFAMVAGATTNPPALPAPDIYCSGSCSFPDHTPQYEEPEVLPGPMEITPFLPPIQPPDGRDPTEFCAGTNCDPPGGNVPPSGEPSFDPWGVCNGFSCPDPSELFPPAFTDPGSDDPDCLIVGGGAMGAVSCGDNGLPGGGGAPWSQPWSTPGGLSNPYLYNLVNPFDGVQSPGDGSPGESLDDGCSSSDGNGFIIISCANACGGFGPVKPQRRFRPVDPRTGEKFEPSLDLVVPLRGRTWSLIKNHWTTRNATSGVIETGRPSHWGHNWVSNLDMHVIEVWTDGGVADDYVNELHVHWGGFGYAVYSRNNATDPFATVSEHGLSIYSNRIQRAGQMVNVWVIERPGSWRRMFRMRSNGIDGDRLRGEILHEEDAWGNSLEYQYERPVADQSLPSGQWGDLYKLIRVIARSKSEASSQDAVDAMLRLRWTPHSVSDPQVLGIDVLRPRPVYNAGLFVEWEWELTQQLEYTYADTGVHAADVGQDGELIQVALLTPLSSATPMRYADSLSEPCFDFTTALIRPSGDAWQRSRQYRYYGTPVADGLAHQLKFVFGEAQLEWALWEDAKATTPVLGSSPDQLLTFTDGGNIVTIGKSMRLLATKEIKYTTATGQVEQQFVMSGCGCGGVGAGRIRMDYEFIDIATPVAVSEFDGALIKGSMEIKSYIGDGLGGWVPDITQWIDLAVADVSAPRTSARMVSEVTLDRSGSGLPPQVYRLMYNADGLLIKAAEPSTVSAYSRDITTNLPVITEVSAAGQGLLHHYEYHTGTGIESGLPSTYYMTDSTGGNETVIQSWDYVTTTNTRGLVSQTTQYTEAMTRAQAASADPNKKQVVSYSYWFHPLATSLVDAITSDGGMSAASMTVERELPGENGPAQSTLEEFQLRDSAGRLAWWRMYDNTLARYDYDDASDLITQGIASPTGGLLRRVLHADPADPVDSLPSSWPGGLSLSAGTGWSGNPEGSSHFESLETNQRYDLVGRRIASKTATGAQTSIWYTMEPHASADDPSGFEWYTQTFVPPATAIDPGDGDATELSGPLTKISLTADYIPLGRRLYSIDWVNRDGDGVLAIQTKASVTGPFSEDTEVGRRFSQHGPGGWVTSTRTYHDIQQGWHDTESFNFDRSGRLSQRTDAGGSIVFSSYDVLNRPTATSVGTASSNKSVLLDIAYGNGPSGDMPSQMTWYVDTGTARALTMTTDFRGRITRLSYPDGPHFIFAYDNLDRVTESAAFTSVPVAIDNPLADRIAYERRFYSQRGLLYRIEQAVQPKSSSPTMIAQDVWRDESGRVLAYWAPGSIATKLKYDKVGRLSTVYYSDRDGDSATGSGSFATMQSLQANEFVLEQSEYRYIDDSGLLDRITHRSLAHDCTSGSCTGALDGLTAGAVTTYTGIYYDIAGRVIAIADFGTGTASGTLDDSGAASPPVIDQLNPPLSVPNPTALVTSYAYSDIGEIDTVTDANGVPTRYWYDDSGRIVGVTENYQSAGVARASLSDFWKQVAGSTLPDEDRTTTFTYNSAGDISKIAASYVDGASFKHRVTEHIYGVSASLNPSNPNPDESLVTTNRLLRHIRYPNRLTGDPDQNQQVTFAYDRAGRLRYYSDIIGLEHQYSYNAKGLLTSDVVINSAWPANVDSSVQRLEYEYDQYASLVAARSRAGTSPSSSIVNEVWFDYEPVQHLLESIVSNPVGEVGIAAPEERATDYQYQVSLQGVTRPDSLTYPDGITVLNATFAQPSPGIDNFAISRPTGFTWNGVHATHPLTTVTHAVDYEYLGGGTSVRKSLPMSYPHAAGMHLDYATPGDSSATALGAYPGMDHFGRVLRHRWIRSNYNPAITPEIFDQEFVFSDSPGGNSFIPAMELQRRGFNESFSISSILTGNRANTLDALNRLTEQARGEASLTPTPITIGHEQGATSWDFDELGNWQEVRNDLNRDGDFADPDETEARSHNLANELVERSNLGIPPDLAVTYDAAGNMISQERSVSGTVSTWNYTYDAWHRLVEVTVTPSGGSPQPRAAYTYDALDQLVSRQADTSPIPDGIYDVRERYYYDADWRLLELRTDTPVGGGPTWSEASVQQFVWGLDYIDELLFIQVDSNADGIYEAGYYVIHDERYSPVALANTYGEILERVSYDAYGQPKITVIGDINGDNVVDSIDQGELLGMMGQHMQTSAAYRVSADLNEDGLIDTVDLGIFLGKFGSTATPGVLSTLPNIHGLGGYLYDQEALLYHVRYRAYDPGLGRWHQRDPAGYIDGMNLYQYALGSPTAALDPYGLFGWSPEGAQRFLDLTGGTHNRFWDYDTGPCGAAIPPGYVPYANMAREIARIMPRTRVIVAIMDIIEDPTDPLNWAGAFPGGRHAMKAGKTIKKMVSDCLKKRGNSFAEGTEIVTADGLIPIEDIQPGDRVLSPETWSNIATTPTSIVSEHHSLVTYTATITQLDGPTQRLEIRAIVPNSWIEAMSIAEGHLAPTPFEYDHTDTLIIQAMLVTAIAPAPPIATGPGRVVMATMSLTADEVIELTLRDNAGEESSIILTPDHPLLLVDENGRATWTAADQLQEGDQLQAQHGRLTVLRTSRLAERHTTHNLSLEAEFEFFAINEVLTHNACPWRYTKHAVDRAIGDTRKRQGVAPQSILEALRTKSVPGRDPGTEIYKGKDAHVVVDPLRKIIITIIPKSKKKRGDP